MLKEKKKIKNWMAGFQARRRAAREMSGGREDFAEASPGSARGQLRASVADPWAAGTLQTQGRVG